MTLIVYDEGNIFKEADLSYHPVFYRDGEPVRDF
jgi:hypothetical protein